MRDHLLDPPTERVALWDGAGRLLSESSPSTTAPAPRRFQAALASDAQHALVGPAGGGKLRILQPIAIEGTTIGVIEIEQDFRPLAAHIWEMQAFAALSLIVFGGILYLLLFRLVGGAVRDLAAEAAANARLSEAERRQSERLGVAAELARLLTQNYDLGLLIRATLVEARRLVEYRRASVVLVEADTGGVWVLDGEGSLRREETITDLARSRPGRAIEGGEPFLDADLVNAPRYAEDREFVAAMGVRSALSLPLISKGRALGALFNMFVRIADAFDIHPPEFMEPAGIPAAAQK